MIAGRSLLVVVPAHNEEHQITRVIETMPGIVDAIIVVDDGSTDATSAVAHAAKDQTAARVDVISHADALGVGAAILSGYAFGVENGYDLMAVMAGDGQMPPEDLPRLVEPVVAGDADYTKANRLAKFAWWSVIPRKRLMGNLMLSAMTQPASGLWGVWDSQTGYTVITAEAAERLVEAGIYPRYGCPNDILIKLAGMGYRVQDVPSAPVYGVGEVSKLRIRRVLWTIPTIIARGFAWRMRTQYIDHRKLRVPLALTFGVGLTAIGAITRSKSVLAAGAAALAAGTAADAFQTKQGSVMYQPPIAMRPRPVEVMEEADSAARKAA